MSFEISLVNMADGTVQGHKAGCADLTRRTAKHADEPWTFEVDNKVEAWWDYNSDFFAECYDHTNCDEEAGTCANAYQINWLPCADHVPASKTGA